LLTGEEVCEGIRWLHNTHFFAAAQKKYVYIYDQQGVEIHCLKKHMEVTHMEYLPYHHLLATIGNAGWLKYQDTSTGSLIAEIRTKLGTPTSTTLNPRNAVVHVGHSNGTVTLWSPNLQTPLAKLLSNRGPIRALAADRGGHYLATAGADSHINIFDIRTFKQLHTYLTPTPPTSLSISDTGLLAAGWGSGHVTLWKDALRTRNPTPYMSHHQPGSAITSLRFCPYEDILAAGHTTGVSSLIVPGAGEPNFDALEANPYAGKKQRQEAEVRGLLEKLRPEMIRLDPDFVGKVADTQPHGRSWEEAGEEVKGRRLSLALEKDEKFKMRGKNSALSRLLRKKGRENVRDERREKLERLKREREESQRREGVPEKLGAALDRFKRKERP
jgi:U3 small nucleolar RNA-associated protein 7